MLTQTLTLSQKLHPRRFTAMSPRMAALLGFILGEQWVDQPIAWLSIDVDGNLVSDAQFIGSVQDFKRNLDNLYVAAELSQEEIWQFRSMMTRCIDNHSRYSL